MKTLAEQQAEAWRLAPDDAKWIAQDADGGWYGYVSEPNHDIRMIINEWGDSTRDFHLYRGQINGWSWRDTLQSREEWEAMKPSELDKANGKHVDEWVPEVGQECELSFECEASFQDLERICTVPGGQKVTINGTADFGHGKVYVFSGKHNGIWFNGYHRSDAFRPIKSKADKLRDKQIELLDAAIIKSDHPSPKTMASRLYDNGCRMTRELDADVIKKLWLHCNENGFCIDATPTFFAKEVAAYVWGELEL